MPIKKPYQQPKYGKPINNVYRALEEIKNAPEATQARIRYRNGEVFFYPNGEIARIYISYSGRFVGKKFLGRGWRIKATKNLIKIYSYGQTPIDEAIFNYVGELEINSCRVVTWSGEMFYARVDKPKKMNFNKDFSQWDSDGRRWEEIKQSNIVGMQVSKTRI